MQMAGGDGMRYLGADPSKPADDLERLVTRALTNSVFREQERLNRA